MARRVARRPPRRGGRRHGLRPAPRFAPCGASAIHPRPHSRVRHAASMSGAILPNPTEPAAAPQDAAELEALRAEIDRLDDALHATLLRRAEVVAAVAALHAKHANPLRPGREAAIIRRLLARHHGALPRHTIVRLWRELLAATTAMQGRFALAVCETDQGTDPGLHNRDRTRAFRRPDAARPPSRAGPGAPRGERGRRHRRGAADAGGRRAGRRRVVAGAAAPARARGSPSSAGCRSGRRGPRARRARRRSSSPPPIPIRRATIAACSASNSPLNSIAGGSAPPWPPPGSRRARLFSVAPMRHRERGPWWTSRVSSPATIRDCRRSALCLVRPWCSVPTRFRSRSKPHDRPPAPRNP